MRELNMRGFGGSLVKRQAKRKVQAFFDGDEVDGIKGIGVEGLKLALELGKPIKDLLPPEKIEELRQSAHEFSWVANAITDEDLIGMVPLWAMNLVRRKGPTGIKWMQEQVAWIRSLFT